MALHHVAALSSVLVSALSGQGHAYTLLLLATELTTPLVNARWVMDKSGMRAHPVYVINGIAMAGTWLAVRVLFLAMYFFPLTWRHANDEQLVRKRLTFILNSINKFRQRRFIRKRLLAHRLQAAS